MHIAAKIPKDLIGMIGEIAVAMKAAAVVTDVLNTAPSSRRQANAKHLAGVASAPS
jgi:hypothetical protein